MARGDAPTSKLDALAWPAIVLALACASCSQGAEPDVRFSPGGYVQDTPATDPTGGDGTAPDAAPTTDDDAASPADDAGTDAGTDAGPPPNAFTGAGAYVATTGPATRKAGHGANTNPAGRACLNCHGDGGGATTFTFAGTVYKNAAGTMPSAQVEIRARDKSGKTRSVYSDADGNFFLPLNPNGDLELPGLVGARNAGTTRLMNAAVAGGNCNNCHKPGTAGRLVLP